MDMTISPKLSRAAGRTRTNHQASEYAVTGQPKEEFTAENAEKKGDKKLQKMSLDVFINCLFSVFSAFSVVN